MDILKSISKIFKMEIVLLLLVVLLFVLFDKECFKNFMEHLDNNEQCDAKTACTKVANLQTHLDNTTKQLNDLKTENNKAVEKINEFKKKTNTSNLINSKIRTKTSKISLLDTVIKNNSSLITNITKSHSKTAKTAQAAKKGVDQMQGANKHMSQMYNS